LPRPGDDGDALQTKLAADFKAKPAVGSGNDGNPLGNAVPAFILALVLMHANNSFSLRAPPDTTPLAAPNF
jgi:hypothetical protein